MNPTDMLTTLALDELTLALRDAEQETGLRCSLIITNATPSAGHCNIWVALGDSAASGYVPLEGLYGGEKYPSLQATGANDLVAHLIASAVRDRRIEEQYLSDFPPIFGEDGVILIP